MRCTSLNESRRWVRICAAVYPVITTLAIMITGNHYIIDAIAGLGILGIGWFIANRITRAGRGAPVGSSSDTVA